MILRLTFHDAQMPKTLNLLSEKTFLPGERAEAKSEAARLLREKNREWSHRKYEVELRR